LHLAHHGEVALALVVLERLLQRGRSLVGPAGSVEDFGKIAERVTLEVEPVRPLDDRDCFAGERFGVGMLPTLGEDARLYLAPKRLCRQVLLVAELAALLGERLRVVVATERAE
jgi:hypothetical protein